MKLKNIILICILLLASFALLVEAIGVFGTRTPPTLFQTTNTTINFSIVVNSTNINLSKNMTIYLMISNNSDGNTYNSNVSTFNLTNNVTNNTVFSVLVPGFNIGFHSWFVNIEDLNGNTSSETFWFEIYNEHNNTLFRWKNNSGNDVMTLHKDTGNLEVLFGNVTAPRFNGTFSTGIGGIIITVDIDDEHIEGDLNTYVDIAGDNMTGNLSFNTSAGANSYVMSNGSFITDVCFQNGTNCDGVFGWVSANNHSEPLATSILLGEMMDDSNYTNGVSWNGTHFQTGVNGSYVVTANIYVNSSTPVNYSISILINANVAKYTNVSNGILGVDSGVLVSSNSFTYVGCVNRGQNISVAVDSTNPKSLQLLNASSLLVERKSERCY